MSYELIVVPPGYKQSGKSTLTTTSSRFKCIACHVDDVELVDEFINIDNMPQEEKTMYEGLFSICPSCKTGHLELLNGNVDFTGPVWIEWY